MRVLRTLESLGTAVMREGVYLLPDTAVNRAALEALVQYIGKIAGVAYILQVGAASRAQQQAFQHMFDRTGRYEELIKNVVVNDEPYTNIVTADYTMANDVVSGCGASTSAGNLGSDALGRGGAAGPRDGEEATFPQTQTGVGPGDG
jgi:hypothetical protein